ncbi:Zinc finger C2H2-type [Trinorchestia longiramus]|nr:Zinc finger C2H2-type [Trinorchestia longiramus]
MGSLVLSCPLCCCQKLSSVEALREHLLYFVYRPIPCPVCHTPITGLQQLVHHLDFHVECLQLDGHSSSNSEGSFIPVIPLVKDVSVVAPDSDLLNGQDVFLARTAPRTKAQNLETALVKKSSNTHPIVDSLIHSGKNKLVQLDLLSIQKEFSASGGAESCSSSMKSCKNKFEFISDIGSKLPENSGPNHSIQFDWNSLHVPCSNSSTESTLSSIVMSVIANESEKEEISNPKSAQHKHCHDVELTEETSNNSGCNSETCLVTDKHTAAVSPGFVTNNADVTEPAKAVPEFHSSLAGSSCSEKLSKRSLHSFPIKNISSQNTMSHHRPSMQAYVCPTCGAKIVGQDFYFRHLQEHTDEVSKCNGKNESTFESNINASSPSASPVPSMNVDELSRFNNAHHPSSLPSSSGACEMQVSVVNSRLTSRQIDGISESTLLIPATREFQGNEVALPQSKSSSCFPPATFNEVNADVISDNGPQILPSKSYSNDFVKSFTKPSGKATFNDTLVQERNMETWRDNNQSRVYSSVEGFSDLDDPSHGENGRFTYEEEASFTSKERKSTNSEVVFKHTVRQNSCPNVNNKTEINSATLSSGLAKNEITTNMKEPYLHKKFHHEQKSTVVGNDREDGDEEEGGCYIPDIQSVWVGRLNASVARDEGKTTQHFGPTQEPVMASTDDNQKNSGILMTLGKSISENNYGDGQFSSKVSSGSLDFDASESDQLGSKSIELDEVGYSCVQKTVSSLPCDNARNDQILLPFCDVHEKVESRSPIAGNVEDVSYVDINCSTEIKKNTHGLNFSLDSSPVLNHENNVACTSMSTGNSNSTSEAEFINLLLKNEEPKGQISGTVFHRECFLALPSPSAVTNSEVPPSVEVEGAKFDVPSLVTETLGGKSTLTTVSKETSCAANFSNPSVNNEVPPFIAGAELQDYSGFVNGNVDSFESHGKADIECSRKLLGNPNDVEGSIDEHNDNMSSFLRSPGAGIDGTPQEQLVSEDAMPGNQSVSSLPLDTMSTVQTGEELDDNLRNIEQNRPKLHECKDCSTTFLNVSNYRRHMREVHNPSREYSCSVCSKSFCSLRQLVNHRGVHESQKKFQCNICGHHCYTAAGIRSHKFQEHKKNKPLPKPFKCVQCDESFARNFGLQRHIYRKHEKKFFPCAHCNKVFSCFENLQNHSVAHSDQNGNVPLVCSSCGSQYKSRFALKRHIAIHHFSPTSTVSKQSFSNRNCSMENDFLDKSIKTSSKLLNCTSGSNSSLPDAHHLPLLGKNSVSSSSSFSRDTSLIPDPKILTAGEVVESRKNRIHQQQSATTDDSGDVATQSSTATLTGLRICTNFSGSVAESLPASRSGFNTRDISSPCDAKTSTVHGPSSIHSRNEHNTRTEADRKGKFHCPVCLQSYTRKDTLKVHLRSHSSERPFECDKCDMTFKRRSVLLTHQDKHTSVAKYHCELCDKRFRFKISLRHHSCVPGPDGGRASLNC